MDHDDKVGCRPLAVRSEDDRGPSYTAAVERSEAAFAHAWAALGGSPTVVDTVGDLAKIVGALPPEAGLTLADTVRIGRGERAGEESVWAVVANVVAMAEEPTTPVRDRQGREHDVLVPGLELGAWILPRADAPVPMVGEAYGCYARMNEALELGDGPGAALAAASAGLRRVAEALGDPGMSVATCLRDGSAVATRVMRAADVLRKVAEELARLAPLADEEEDDGCVT